MPSYKVGRVAEDIKRELAYIIREIKDPAGDRYTERCEG